MVRKIGYLLFSLLVIAFISCGGGGGESAPPAPARPNLSGVWAGTWSGTDPIAGQVTGSWEAELTQSETGVSGAAFLGGDVDCSEGTVAGALGSGNIPSGSYARNPCQQNTWAVTALDLAKRSTSGSWTQPGTGASGTFTGTQIAKPAGPRIAFFSPQSGPPGTVVTVVGTGFDPVAANNVLKFNDVAPAQIISLSGSTTLVAKVPLGATSGPLTLATPQEKAISPRSFVSTASFPSTAMKTPLAVGSSPEGVAMSPDATRLYVANRLSGSVSMIGTVGGRVLATTAIPGQGAVQVYGLAVSHDGRRLFVDYYDQGASERGIAVLHGATATVLEKIIVATAQAPPLAGNPQGLALSPDGRLLFLANHVDGGAVYVLDVAARQVVASETMGAGARPTALAVSPDGLTAYLAFSGADVVRIFAIPTRSITATIGVEAGPTALDVAPDGLKVYVANNLGNSVSLIDTATRQVQATWPSFAAPVSLAVSPDGSRVYVVNQGSGSVSVVRTADAGREATTPAGTGPAGLVISPDGKKAYLTLAAENGVGELGGTATLTIAKAGSGIGRVTSASESISCGVSCQADFSAGTTVALTAVPDGGSVFAGWSGDPDCADGVVTLNAGLVCTATFNVVPQSGGGSGGGGCFIATAAYGSSLDPHVEALRIFRDRYLLTSRAGRAFVAFYYRQAPPLAAFIARHETLRLLARWALTPLVYGIEWLVQS